MTEWQLRTNRHPATNGTSWGWIEGPKGNVCWADDNRDFNSRVAASFVTRHNAGEDVTVELQAILKENPNLGWLEG